MRNSTYKQNKIFILAYVIFGLFMGLFFDLLLSTHIYTLSLLSIFFGFFILGVIFKIILSCQNKKGEFDCCYPMKNMDKNEQPDGRGVYNSKYTVCDIKGNGQEIVDRIIKELLEILKE